MIYKQKYIRSLGENITKKEKVIEIKRLLLMLLQFWRENKNISLSYEVKKQMALTESI